MAGGGILSLMLLLLLALLFPMAQADATAPRWATPDHLWFRISVPGGDRWMHVDAANGVKEPLFDHQRLAVELNRKTGGDYTALTLPFKDPSAAFVVKYDGSNIVIADGAMAIEFAIDGDAWRCDLQGEWDWARTPPSDYYCEKERGTGPVARPTDMVRSPDGRWQASIVDANVVVRPAAAGALVRLSSDGRAGFAYEAGSLKWSADSRSLAAYRVNADVWKSADGVGNVKSQVVRGEWIVR